MRVVAVVVVVENDILPSTATDILDEVGEFNQIIHRASARKEKRKNQTWQRNEMRWDAK